MSMSRYNRYIQYLGFHPDGLCQYHSWCTTMSKSCKLKKHRSNLHQSIQVASKIKGSSTKNLSEARSIRQNYPSSIHPNVTIPIQTLTLMIPLSLHIPNLPWMLPRCPCLTGSMTQTSEPLSKITVDSQSGLMMKCPQPLSSSLTRRMYFWLGINKVRAEWCLRDLKYRLCCIRMILCFLLEKEVCILPTMLKITIRNRHWDLLLLIQCLFPTLILSFPLQLHASMCKSVC